MNYLKGNGSNLHKKKSQERSILHDDTFQRKQIRRREKNSRKWFFPKGKFCTEDQFCTSDNFERRPMLIVRGNSDSKNKKI